MAEKQDTRTEHKTIHTAIAAAMREVKTLAKTETNKHGNYTFTSVDDFLGQVGRLAASHGLFVITDELECAFENVGKGQWRVVFSFTLCHENGDTLSPQRRTIIVHNTGPQSFGTAQSYALKQFLRAMFMVPTGDKDDVDYQPQQELAPPPPTQQPREVPFWERDKLTFPAEDPKDFARKLVAWVANAPDLARLDKLEKDNTAGIKALPDATIDYLIGKITERRAFLAQAPAEQTPFDEAA